MPLTSIYFLISFITLSAEIRQLSFTISLRCPLSGCSLSPSLLFLSLSRLLFPPIWISLLLLLLLAHCLSLPFPCAPPILLISKKFSTLCVTTCPLVTLIQIRVKTFVYCEEGRERERNGAVLNVKDDEVGQAASAVAIAAVCARHRHKPWQPRVDCTIYAGERGRLPVPLFHQEIKFTCYLAEHPSTFPSNTSDGSERMRVVKLHRSNGRIMDSGVRNHCCASRQKAASTEAHPSMSASVNS